MCCVAFITQMIFQQPNPGVRYEYRLPTEHTASSQQEGENLLWEPVCLTLYLCLLSYQISFQVGELVSYDLMNLCNSHGSCMASNI